MLGVHNCAVELLALAGFFVNKFSFKIQHASRFMVYCLLPLFYTSCCLSIHSQYWEVTPAVYIHFAGRHRQLVGPFNHHSLCYSDELTHFVIVFSFYRIRLWHNIVYCFNTISPYISMLGGETTIFVGQPLLKKYTTLLTINHY